MVAQAGSSRAPASSTVVLLSPDALPASLIDALAWPHLAVPFTGLAHAGPHDRVGAATAALAADVVLAVLPATVGIDSVTAQIWRIAADAGVPRAVLVSDLGPSTADYEDLAAIAVRVLGEECVLWRLPVFDDALHVVGSMDLATGDLHTQRGIAMAGRAHKRVSVGPRLRLVEAVAGTVEDSAAARAAMAISDAADADDPDADLIVWGGDDAWDLTTFVAAAFAAGDLAPVMPVVEMAEDVKDLLDLAQVTPGAHPPQRLIRRGAYDEPTDGDAGVVLAANGPWALVRTVYGDRTPTDGLVKLTRSGVGMPNAGTASVDDGLLLAAYRSWPIGVVESGSSSESVASVEGGNPVVEWQWVRLTLLPEVGDVLARHDLWLVNEPLDT